MVWFSLICFALSFAGICLAVDFTPARISRDIENSLNPDVSLRGRALTAQGRAGKKRLPFPEKAIRRAIRAYEKERGGIGTPVFAAVAVSFSGASAAAVLGIWFLLPVSLLCGVFLPYFLTQGAVAAYEKKLGEELETALSVITSAYLRTGNTVDSVSQSLPNIKPPVRDVFRDFTVNATMVSSDIILCIREMQNSVDNKIFREWCEFLVACQEDSSNRSSLLPVLDRMAEQRLVNSELETMISGCRREYLGMVLITLCNLPLLYIINREWFYSLINTGAGQAALSVCGCVILVTACIMLRLTRPVDEERLQNRK